MAVIGGMFGGGLSLYNADVLWTLWNNIFFLAAALIACTPLGKNLRAWRYEKTEGRGRIARGMQLIDTITPVILIFFSACALVGNSYNPFLYFQF